MVLSVRTRWVCALVVALTLWPALAVAAVATAPAASAHAVLETSTPADGAQLDRAPARVSLTFDESVGLDAGYLRVIDAQGDRVETGRAFHPDGHDDTVAVTLPAGLGTSAYLVSYRVVSADSHPVGGSIRFTVGDATGLTPPNAADQPTDRSVGIALDVLRALSYAALVLAAGTWLYLVGPSPSGPERRRARAMAGVGGLTLAVLALAELWLQGAYAQGTGWATLWQWTPVADTLRSGFGRWHLIQAVTAVTAVALARRALRTRPVPRGVLAGTTIAALLTVLALAAPGHASAPPLSPLAIASTTLHVLAVSAWVGGLMVLVLGLRRGDDARFAAVLPTFSRVAVAAVAVIGVTGVFQAARLLRAWSPVIDTTYGRLVLVKLGLLLVLAGLGAVSRAVVRSGRTDEADGRARVRRGVVVEVVLALAVFGVTGVLTAEPFERAPATAPAVTASVSQSAEITTGRVGTLTVAPARAGVVTVSLDLTPGPAVQRLTVTATQTAAGIGPLPVRLSALRDGHAEARGVLLPRAGDWRFDITAQTSAFDSVVASITVTLQ